MTCGSLLDLGFRLGPKPMVVLVLLKVLCVHRGCTGGGNPQLSQASWLCFEASRHAGLGYEKLRLEQD